MPETPDLVDSLAHYLNQADHELLTAEEEQILARRIQRKGWGWKQARQRLREANLLLVVHIAGRFSKFKLPLDDRIQEGNLALMRAVDGFQPGRGKFSTYAGGIIEHAIMRACREQSGVIRVPEHVHQSVHRGTREAPAALNDSFSLIDEEIAEEEELDEAEEARERVTAFKARVRSLLGTLTEKEQLIVSQRLGMDGKKPRMQKEIAEELGLCRGAISMAERIAIRKLLEAVGGKYSEPPKDASHGSYAALFRMIEQARSPATPVFGVARM
jgi:RNA polymerase primary sigma factor